jgi:hypothetical protein
VAEAFFHMFVQFRSLSAARLVPGIVDELTGFPHPREKLELCPTSSGP